ncbi:MAG: hypothetical protein WBV80_04215 [Mycobacterium sp.]
MAASPTTWMAPSADGRLEVFVPGIALDTRSVQLWHLYQTSPAGGWSQWVSQGSPPGAHDPWAGPVVAPNAAGRLELMMGFDTASPFGPWHISQTAQNNGWTPTWTTVGIPPGTSGVSTSYAMATNAFGGLELFVTSYVGQDGDQQIWYIGQASTSFDWLRYTPLGAPSPGGALTPVVAASADGRLEVFTTAGDGALWHIWQTSVGGGWSPWTSHGRPSSTGSLLNATPVIAANSQGRLELLVVAGDFQLWHIYQTAPSGGWSDWVSHGTPPGDDIIGSTPAMAADADGRLELFISGGYDSQLWHLWQTTPSGSWSQWHSHGKPQSSAGGRPGVWNTPALALNSDKRLELFVPGSNSELWHIWQTTRGGGWSDWLSHGKPTGFDVFGVFQ